MSEINSSAKRTVILGVLMATFALFLLSGSALMGQTALLSQATWGGFGSDSANAVAVAADGSSFVVGITDSFAIDQFGQPAPRIFLLKYAPDGSLASQRIWDGTTIFGSFLGPDVALGPGGSVYVTGSTGTNGGDAFLLKFDANGNLIWQRTWGGFDFEVSNAVATAADGSAYIVGTTRSFGTAANSPFIVKFDAAGTLVWQKIWQPGGEGFAVAVAPDGSVYFESSVPRANQIGNFDILVLKMAPDSSVVWSRTYSAGFVVDARGGMTVASDGSLYIAGAIQAPTMGFVDIAALLVRLAPDGSLVFDKEWGGRKSGEAAEGVAVAPDGTIYVAGSSSSFGAGGSDAFVVHFLPTGRATGAATWGGAGFDNGNGVGVAGDGTIVLAGAAQAPPYFFLSAPKKTSNPKSTLGTPAGSLSDVAGTVSDPAQTVTITNGSTTYAGSVDAALVRIAP